jgi:hypothetical protein
LLLRVSLPRRLFFGVSILQDAAKRLDWHIENGGSDLERSKTGPALPADVAEVSVSMQSGNDR